jgi:PAS domain-containing protein
MTSCLAHQDRERPLSQVESELIAFRDIARLMQQPCLERDADAERRLHELLQNLPAATYTTDAAGRITFYNEAAVAFWGCRPTLNSDQWCVRGAYIGPTARRCRTTSARWPLR